MFRKPGKFARFVSTFALIFAFGLISVRAQSELEDIKYKEDYDRIQRILKVTDPLKRADQMVTLYRERPDMSTTLRDYADKLFTRDLETLMKQRNFIGMRSLCEKSLKARPRFGEAYFFQGIVLKNEKKDQDALTAFARANVILEKNHELHKKAKQQLDLLYRATHGGSLIGQDKLLREATLGLKK